MSIQVAHYREKKHYSGDIILERQTLTEHLFNSSLYCQMILEKVGLPLIGKLLGLIHDFGKAADIFQRYLRSSVGIYKKGDPEYIDPEEMKGKIDHSTSGAQYLINNIEGLDPDLKKAICLCLVSHHSGLINCFSNPIDEPDIVDVYKKRINKDYGKSDYNNALKNIDKDVLEEINKIDVEKLNEEFRLFKQKVFSFITGNNIKSKYIFYFQYTLFVKVLFSALVDADRSDTSEFSNPYIAKTKKGYKRSSWDQIIDEFEGYIGKFKSNSKINKIRKEVSDNCLSFANKEAGIYSLTVPTGGAKTLGSFRFALHHAKKNNLDKIFYIIPFTTIIKQNAEEIRKSLGNKFNEDILEHHSNLNVERKKENINKNDGEDEDISLERFRNKIFSDNWDKPIIFTTMVQFLNSIYGPKTSSSRRFHQLTNSVIVFDECQEVPIKTINLFNNACNFLNHFYNSTILMCTATQPLLHRVDNNFEEKNYKGHLLFNKDPEIMGDSENVRKKFLQLKRTRIIDLGNCGNKKFSYKDIVKETYKKMAKNKSNNCLIGVNTKKACREIYKLISLTKKGYSVFCLHKDMCDEHINEVLEKVKDKIEKNEKVICIATNLIECGVDIDFDMGVKYYAGISSIIQFCGRVNRNGKKKIGIVYLVSPDDEEKKRMNPLKHLVKGIEITKNILLKLGKKDIISPEIIEQYFNKFYDELNDEMKGKVKDKDGLCDHDMVSLLSINKKKINENIIFRQAFQTSSDSFSVIDQFTRAVLVPYKKGSDIILDLCRFPEEEKGTKRWYDLLRQSQAYSINMYPDTFEKCLDNESVFEIGKGQDIYHLREGLYNEQIGFDKGVDVEMVMLIDNNEKRKNCK